MSRVKFYLSAIESLADEWLTEKYSVAEEGDGGDAPRKNCKTGVGRIANGKEKRCCDCSGIKNPDGKRKR